MVTDWKNMKLIRKFVDKLLSLTLMTGALLVCLGQPAMLPNLIVPELWIGNPIAVPEFRAFVSELYNNYGLVLNGVGDDTGTPLTNRFKAEQVQTQALQALNDQYEQAGGTLLLYNSKNQNLNNYTGGSLFAESDGHLTLPADHVLLFELDEKGAFLANSTMYNYYLNSDLQNRPARSELGAQKSSQAQIVMALPSVAGEGPLKGYWRTAQLWCKGAIVLLACLLLAGLFALRGHCTRDAAAQSRREVLALTGKMWTEAKLALLVADFTVAVGLGLFFYRGNEGIILRLAAGDIGGAVLLLLGPAALAYLLLFDLWGNRRQLWAGSALYRACRAVQKAQQRLRGKLPWQRRALLFCALSAICLPVLTLAVVALLWLKDAYSNGVFALFTILLCLLAVAYWGESILTSIALVRESGLLANKAIALQHGDLGYAETPLLPADKFHLLGGGAQALNELESGISTAIEQQMRAERMKVELISNVSHDLKTPLTSIISYADLLCGEELSPAAADYAKVLQKKAYQLKGMVQDVFELSKATSGNLPVAPEPLDLAKLLRQTLADMDDLIRASGLVIRTELPEQAWVVADGQRLYRVFQNLIDNALRYSLEGSRIYLAMALPENQAVVTVKNVSRFEMDFAPTDIVERFVRADPSRSTAGSGLGLSIAKSFTEACGGRFEISLNADLFCATVTLPLTEPAPAQAAQPVAAEAVAAPAL